jgi:hypothetical protein
MSNELVTLQQVKDHPKVNAVMAQADSNLAAIGYTEHGERHATRVSKEAHEVLQKLGFENRIVELGAIGGYLHDIGNAVNRKTHGQSGAFLASMVLTDLGMSFDDILTVMSAVANHDENEGAPVNAVASAVILADKADVHRSRVRNPKEIDFDIHDRVNYAVIKSDLAVDSTKRTVTLELTIDTKISNVMEYFEIFLSRMLHCRRAAKMLGCEFKLSINETVFL